MTAERLTDELAVAEFGNQVELSAFTREHCPHKAHISPSKVVEQRFAFNKESALKLRDWLLNEFPIAVDGKE